MTFADRRDAGRQLADALASRDLDDPVVIALPRGGVPVAAEVAGRLDAPLDVIVVRKLGCPGHSELGVGAIGEGGVRLLNERLIGQLRLTRHELDTVTAEERAELERRVARYRAGRCPTDVAGRSVVLVDDGLATGYTAQAAVAVLRRQGAARILLAVPVGPPTTVEELERVADEVVCLDSPDWFLAIGEAYGDFRQVSDEDVARILRERALAAGVTTTAEAAAVREVQIPAGATQLPGTLTVPSAAAGAVIFAHGSGSSRLSPRNVEVAQALNAGGLATLLFDLLTSQESLDRANVFDIGLLADRLIAATHWLREQPEAARRRIGYFGASTGAAAALQAAARVDDIGAVVSRGGRPDLAGEHLATVTAPTLLIVGGRDHAVIELNRRAQRALSCVNRLEIVPGATHLFEEPGALDAVAELAGDWFRTHLPVAGQTVGQA